MKDLILGGRGGRGTRCTDTERLRVTAEVVFLSNVSVLLGIRHPSPDAGSGGIAFMATC